ncbi:importin beta-3 subunit, putative [Entamoeba invadens IP1]|uniref:importin beta-3 subunit, putative n=1 Tax=Entamoeba invadens IP1 TaxID=370355 RepID=UPI0002C3ED33|nr:importin beta-3 subunit, putative [Entamoeba invadens IP1]ELP93167.1 importin beta-3 subunit, putative [Entamoeba invadens IP1]|eukprot:XP_004259938.1 importin beta-3 subunit, putative [Entamoeba invadens IP1]
MATNIVQAFQATLSPNPNVRAQGEVFLRQIESNYENLPQLVQAALPASGQSTQNRKSILLCFGRMIKKLIDPRSVPEQIISMTCNLLLQLLKQETELEMKAVVAASVYQFAEILSNNDMDWFSYFPTIMETLNDQRMFQKLCALEILGNSVAFKGWEVLTSYVPQLLQLCASFLASGNYQVQTTVLDFLANSTALTESTENFGNTCKLLFAPIQTVVLQLYQANEKDKFDEITTSVCQLIENSDYIFSGKECELSQNMFTILNTSLVKETQQSAMEVIIVLIENNASVFKKNNAMINIVVKRLLEWMRTIDDESAQLMLNNEDPIDIENFSYAADALIRVVSAAGGAPIKDTLFSTCLEYLKSNNWKERYAALTALSLCVEPGKFIFKTTMSDLLKLVINFITDQNGLVLFGMLSLLDSLIECFPKMCRRRHFEQIMQVVIAALNIHLPIVQDKACFIFSQVLDTDDANLSEKLAPFIPKIFEGVFVTLNTNNWNSISNALSVLITLSRVAMKKMEPFYQNIKTAIDVLLPKFTTRETLEHKGKVIELMCIYASINPGFFPESRQIAVSQLEVISNGQEIMSPMLVSVLSGICLLCENNDQPFKQYIQLVVTLILKRLIMKENTSDVIMDDVNARTSATQEKNYLIQSLIRIVTALKGEYGNYVEDTLKVLLPLMNDVHTTLRETSSKLIPLIFESYVEMMKVSPLDQNTKTQRTITLFYIIVDHICELVKKESLTDNLVSYLECLNIVLVLAGDNVLDVDRIKNIFESFDMVLKKILDGEGLEDGVLVENEIDTNVLDEEQYDNIVDDSSETLDYLTLLMQLNSWICKSHQKTFFPVFQFTLFPRVMSYLKQTEENDKTAFAVAILGSVITDGKIYDFVPQITEQFLVFAHNSNTDIANNAIYFLGQFAKDEIQNFVPFIPKLLETIGTMLNRKKTRAVVELQGQVMLTLGNVLIHYYTQIPQSKELMCQLLGAFPTKGMYDVLIEMLDEMNKKGMIVPIISIGNVANNIYKLVLYFANALEKENTEDDTKLQMAALIQTFSTVVSQDVIAQIWSKLSIDQRGDLDSLFHK